MRRALAVVIAAAFWPFTTTAQSVPKIDIVYPPGGSLFDRGCQKITGKAADPDRIAKVVAKQPEFQAAWEEFGPTYLRTAIEIVGRPFPYPAMQVALTVCEIGGVGMSMPLMIAPERFMRDRNDPLGYHEMWEFAEITFHELMHNYARDTYETSALRQKYAGEPQVVLNHLPVVAIERAVMTKLGEREKLAHMFADYKGLDGGFVARAWEIVSQEGVEAVIAELRAGR